MNNAEHTPTPPMTPDDLLRRAISTYGLPELLSKAPIVPKDGSDAIIQLFESNQGEDVHLISTKSIKKLHKLAPSYFAGAQLCAHVSRADHTVTPQLGDARVIWLVSDTMPSINNPALKEAIHRHSLGRAEVTGGLYRAHPEKGTKSGMWRCSAGTTARLKSERGDFGRTLDLELAPYPELSRSAISGQSPIPLAALKHWHHSGWQHQNNSYLSLKDIEYLHQWHTQLAGHSEGAVLAASLHWTPKSMRCDQWGINLDIIPKDMHGKMMPTIEKLLEAPEGRSEITNKNERTIEVIRRGQGLSFRIKSPTYGVSDAYFHEDRRLLHALVLGDSDRGLGMEPLKPTFTPVTDPAPQIWAGILERIQAQRWSPTPLG